MALEKEVAVVHPEGEQELVVVGGPNPGSTVDTFGGMIHVKWDETAAVTPFGQLAFFVEFLKTAGLWEAWVKDCPVTYESHNAPTKAEVFGQHSAVGPGGSSAVRAYYSATIDGPQGTPPQGQAHPLRSPIR